MWPLLHAAQALMAPLSCAASNVPASNERSATLASSMRAGFVTSYQVNTHLMQFPAVSSAAV
jgi:hypothetical protein